MWRLTEPVQKSLDGVTCKESLEIISSLLSEVRKALSDRRSEVANIPGVQMIASRYGRITFATRHTLAYFHSSSIVARR